MRFFSLPPPLVLAGTAVSAINSCLDPENVDYRCPESETFLRLSECGLTETDLGDLAACFDNAGTDTISEVDLGRNSIPTLPVGIFGGLDRLEWLELSFNELTTLPVGLFDGLDQLVYLSLSSNHALSYLPPGIFDGLVELDQLDLDYLALTTLTSGIFDGLENLTELKLSGNLLTLQADVFSGVPMLTGLSVFGNDDLQCLPAIPVCDDCSLIFEAPDGFDADSICECPVEGACSGCQPGEDGYTCDDSGSTTCSNGFPGMDGSKKGVGEVCCSAGCPTCGGLGCATAGLPEFDAFDCCVGRILSSAADCDIAGAAPCIISGATTCSNGLPGLDGSSRHGDVCCPLGCNKCGGKNCSKAGLPDYDKFDCCIGRILSSAHDCDSTEAAPCVISF